MDDTKCGSHMVPHHEKHGPQKQPNQQGGNREQLAVAVPTTPMSNCTQRNLLAADDEAGQENQSN